jgi:hypothetical protein
VFRRTAEPLHANTPIALAHRNFAACARAMAIVAAQRRCVNPAMFFARCIRFAIQIDNLLSRYLAIVFYFRARAA